MPARGHNIPRFFCITLPSQKQSLKNLAKITIDEIYSSKGRRGGLSAARATGQMKGRQPVFQLDAKVGNAKKKHSGKGANINELCFTLTLALLENKKMFKRTCMGNDAL